MMPKGGRAARAKKQGQMLRLPGRDGGKAHGILLNQYDDLPAAWLLDPGI
jgi:hypothetical protein